MPHVRLPAFLAAEGHTLHDALTDSEELEKMHCAQVVAALKVTLAEEQRFLEREKRLRLMAGSGFVGAAWCESAKSTWTWLRGISSSKYG